MSERTARLEGTPLQPRLVLTFDPRASTGGVRLPAYPPPRRAAWSRAPRRAPSHPGTLREWVKALPGRRWDPDREVWEVCEPGPNIDAVLAGLGFDVDFGPASGRIRHLGDLAAPKVVLEAEDPHGARVHLRFADFARVEALLPDYREWDPATHSWWVSTADLLRCDPALPVPERILDEAERIAARPPFRRGACREDDVARLAAAAGELDVPDRPDLWVPRRPLFGYQASGARAVTAGHCVLADEPGLGKTSAAIVAHASVGTRRLVVVCPPIIASNWRREIELAGWDVPVSVIRPGRKVPDFPPSGVVVVADSLLGARPSLVEGLLAWSPDGLIVDEAHREKGLDSKRSRAVRRLAHGVDGLRVPITGTPLVSTPRDLAPILDISGHLEEVFGGLSAFMDTYCRWDRMRGWVPRRGALGDLRDILDQRVWVRRRKEDVLDLPPLLSVPLLVDVDLAGFRRAHAEAIATIEGWLGDLGAPDPGEEEIDALIESGAFELVSRLRKAAGLAKIPAARDWVGDFVEAFAPADRRGPYERPLVVWTHHRVVTRAMVEAVSDLDAPVASIWGDTPATDVPRIIDDFQAGRIAVLVASMSAAGTGVTLTRACDALFVETDWTPALVQQATDRQRRIGQTRPMTVTTLVGPGTLDERVQCVLAAKAAVLDPVLGEGNDVSVMDAPAASARDLVRALVEVALAKRHRRVA